MTIAGGVIRPFLASSVARGLRAAVRIGLLLIAARAYSLAEVGQFAFVMGTGTLIIGLLDLGVTSLLQREVAARGFDAGVLERRAFLVRILTLPLGIALSWGMVIGITGDFSSSALGTLLFVAGLATAEFLAGLRRARGEFDLEPLEVAPATLAGIVAGLVVAVAHGSVGLFQSVVGIATALAVLPRAALVRRRLWSEPAPPGPALFDLLWQARWFWLITAGALVLFEAPAILLRRLASEEAVALYATAMRAVGLASQPFAVLTAVFVPSLAFESNAHRDGYLESVRGMNRLFLVGTPVAIALALGGGVLFLRGAGPEYTGALTTLWVLVVGTLVYLGAPSAGPLLVEGLERALAVAVLLASIVTIGLCTILAPTMGAAGAALAAAGGFTFGKIAHAFLYQHRRLPALGARGVVIACATVVWISVSYLLQGPWNVMLLTVGAIGSGIMTLRTVMYLRLFQRTKRLMSHSSFKGRD